jgi:hypothetical protein
MWLVLFVITIIKGYYGDSSEDNQSEENSRQTSEQIRNLDKNSISYERFYWLTFHSIQVIGGMAFLCMLMTNWMALDYAYYSFKSEEGANTNHAMYIQMICSWIAGVLYIWSLFASKFCGP